MQRLNRTVVDQETEIDITPMLDVVFIMLIFFIVTASFVKESGIDLYKPSSSEPSSITVRPIVVKLNSQNEITIQDRLVDSRAIKAIIIRLKDESPEASVIVNIHEKAKTKSVIQTIDGIRAAKVMLPAITLLKH